MIFSRLIVRFGLVQLAALCTLNALAQEPVVVNVVLMPPYPNYADELIQLGDEAIITLQNTDFVNGYSVKLGVELDGSNGITVRTREDAMPNQAIQLNPGETVILSGTELSSFYNNYNESNFDYTGITIDEIVNDQSLPDGIYTLCVRAYDFQTNLPLSPPEPLGCAAPFTVVAVDPPIITYPANNQVLQPQDPQFFNINWIPVSVALPDLRYRLEMVEMNENLINPYDAFNSPDFLFLFEDNIAFNSFLYGMEYPLLQVGTQYAIRVRAYREDGLLNVNNDGYSDIVIFRYGEEPPFPPDDNAGTPTFTSTLNPQQLDCGSDCEFTLPNNAQASDDLMRTGSTLSMGHFQLFVNSINQSGSTYSGQGVIQPTDYLPVGIKVEFTGLRATADGRVIDGTAEAVIRENSWVDHTWSDLQEYGEGIDVGKSSEAWQNAIDPNFYLENLTSAYQQVGTSLPINIGQDLHRLQIVGMHFFPDRAAYNLAYIQKLDDDAFGERYLNFVAKNLCITPGGPSVGVEESRLELVKPVRYHFNNFTSLEFTPAGAGSGTHLLFDCNGLVGVNALGTARFDPSVFKPVDAEGNVQPDTVMCAFQTSYVEWSDWVAQLDFQNVPGEDAAAGVELNRFVYSELEDYVIRVEEAFFDHSIMRNPEYLVLPENFAGDQSEGWQGAYIKQVEVQLPKWIISRETADDRVRVSGYDLILDGDGLTGEIVAENVLLPDEGSLGSWHFSILDLSLSIIHNSLDAAAFSGSLQIPVVEEPFNYSASVQYFEQATLHTFNLNPSGDYTFPVWFAEATISENSSIEILTALSDAYVEARLHGDISFAPVIGHIDKNNLTDITFNDMVVRNKRQPTYVEFGNIGTNITEQTLAVAGFGATLEHLDWQEANMENAGLLMGLGLDLAGGLSSISGGTEMFLKTQIEEHVDSVSFVRDGTSISGIYLEAETAAMTIKGEVNYFDEDPAFGSGFDGSLELAFLESIKLDGSVMFGNQQNNAYETFNYWYAFAMAWLPESPAPLATPVDIYAFGGGMFYNMAVNRDMPDPQAIGGTTVNPREAFVVSQGSAGLQASVVLALTPSTRTFNADATLTAEFDINNFGINYINFTGAGYVMQEIDAENKEEAMVGVTVVIEYDFPAETLSAEMRLEGEIPKETPLLNISGTINFFRSPALWYFKAGVPQNPLITSLDLGIVGVDASAYFMTGQRLPPPVLPAEVEEFFTFNSTLADNMANDLGIGFLAGVHLALGVDLMALGTGLEIHGLAGVDISLMHWYAALCNGSEDFGVNKWYAMGQGYVHGKFLFNLVGFEAASLTAGVILEGAFPNPTGVNGVAKAELQVLGGLVKESVEEPFSLGEMCSMTPIPTEELIASGMLERPETELEGIDMIGQISPPHLAGYISTTIRPTIEWKVKPEERRFYAYGDGFGGLVEKEFKFSVLGKWYRETESGLWSHLDYQIDYDEDTYTHTYTPVSASGSLALINGSTRYKVEAVAKVLEKKNGVWEDALYLEGPKIGQPISQTDEHIFTTATNLTEIEPLYVDYTLPYTRQRFLPYDYLQRGHFQFNVDHEAKFQDFEACGFELYAEFRPISGGNWERFDITRENLLKIRYDMPQLAPSTIYEMRVVAERLTTVQELNEETNENCQIVDDNSLEPLVENLINTPDLGGSLNAPLNSSFMNNYAGLEQMGGIVGMNSEDDSEITQTKVLYTLYFRTSMYATPSDKMNSIAVSGVQVQSQQTYNWPNFITLRRAYVGLSCGEGFDKYDILGYDFQAQAGLTAEYFSAFGPSYETKLSGAPEAWYDEVFTNVYPNLSQPTNGSLNLNSGYGGAAQQAAEAAQAIRSSLPSLSSVGFRADASNYTGIKHVMPLLSDVEVGLSAPAAVDPETVSSFLTANAGNSSSTSGGSGGSSLSINTSGSSMAYSGGFSLAGASGSFGAGGFGGTPVMGGGPNYKLELDFNVDQVVYNARNTLRLHPLLFGDIPDHTPLPNGTYPIEIKLVNDTDLPNNQPAGATKTLQVTIQ